MCRTISGKYLAAVVIGMSTCQEGEYTGCSTSIIMGVLHPCFIEWNWLTVKCLQLGYCDLIAAGYLYRTAAGNTMVILCLYQLFLF